MVEFYNWLTTTPAGLAAALGTLLVFFLLVAVLYERKTRKLYPDRDRRGTKAVAKAKAANKAKTEKATAKKPVSSKPAQKKPAEQEQADEDEDESEDELVEEAEDESEEDAKD